MEADAVTPVDRVIPVPVGTLVGVDMPVEAHRAAGSMVPLGLKVAAMDFMAELDRRVVEAGMLVVVNRRAAGTLEVVVVMAGAANTVVVDTDKR